MNTTEIEPRTKETFVIAKTDEGFRVCSPLTPGNQYIVSGLPDAPRCTCPEFASHDGELGWQCKHIQAVLKDPHLANQSSAIPPTAPAGARGGNEPPTRTQKKAPGGRNGDGTMMLLKRSVSPDGRIDSLSVEFSCPVGIVTADDLKRRAAGILALQGEIAAGFLKANGNGKQPANSGAQNTEAGQLLAVASMNGKWGKRLFLNILVNGKVMKFFGSEKELADAVTAAGFGSVAEHLADGYTLNLPCRVVTKPSPDGKYVNVDRILPAQAVAPQ